MEFLYNRGKEKFWEDFSIFCLSLIMNTISKMCVAPSLKGKTSTTLVANLPTKGKGP